MYRQLAEALILATQADDEIAALTAERDAAEEETARIRAETEAVRAQLEGNESSLRERLATRGLRARVRLDEPAPFIEVLAAKI